MGYCYTNLVILYSSGIDQSKILPYALHPWVIIASLPSGVWGDATVWYGKWTCYWFCQRQLENGRWRGRGVKGGHLEEDREEGSRVLVQDMGLLIQGTHTNQEDKYLESVQKNKRQNVCLCCSLITRDQKRQDAHFYLVKGWSTLHRIRKWQPALTNPVTRGVSALEWSWGVDVMSSKRAEKKWGNPSFWETDILRRNNIDLKCWQRRYCAFPVILSNTTGQRLIHMSNLIPKK